MVLGSGNHWFQWFSMVVHNWSNDGIVASKSRIYETKRIWLSQFFAFFSFLGGIAHNCCFFSFGMHFFYAYDKGHGHAHGSWHGHAYNVCFFVPMVIATGMPMTNSTGTPMTCVFCAHGNGHGHAHGYSHGRAYDYAHGHIYYWQTRGGAVEVFEEAGAHDMDTAQPDGSASGSWAKSRPPGAL